MFASRFTALIDACALAGALTRNVTSLVTTAGLFSRSLVGSSVDETEPVIAEFLTPPDDITSATRAARVRRDGPGLRGSFRSLLATVGPGLHGLLPDLRNATVVVASRRAQAAVVVTDHLPKNNLIQCRARYGCAAR